MNIYPSQKLPYSKKNDSFVHQTLDYYIEQAFFNDWDREEMDALYRAAEGTLVDSDYKYVLNPYSTDNDKLKNYPSRMRNYDIISPVLNLFLGEKAKRPSQYEVVVNNSDSENAMKEELDGEMTKNLTQRYINKLNELNVPTGVNSKPVDDPAVAARKFMGSYDDRRAAVGQEAIDYLTYDLDLKDKYQDGLYDYLVTGRVITYKDVYRDDVDHEIVPPKEIRAVGLPHSGYLEDSDAVIRLRYWTPNQILDRFRSDLNDEDIEWLENEAATLFNNTAYIHLGRNETNHLLQNDGELPVFHVTWKTFKKVGILTYINVLGQRKEREVDEIYKLDKANGDISIKWEWINEIWEGWRISDKIYIGGEPLLVQRDELNNSSVVKHPYNGRFTRNKDGRLTSFVKNSLPYQLLYNIFRFRFELTMARNKDKLMLMPIGLLPEGWDETKFLYFAEATSIAFFDESKENAAQVLQAIKSIDMSLGQYAAKMVEFIRSIKEDYWESVGVNRQRYGDVGQSAGKGVTEQAIFRSSIISEELFRRFEKFEEKDIAGLLDYSKFAWLEGKKGAYINSDGRKAFLNINGWEHLETDYGIFIKNTSEEREKLEQMKQAAFAFAQNGEQADLVAEILDGNNFAKVKSIIKKGKALQDARIERKEELDRQNNLQVQELKNQEKKDEFQIAKYRADMSYREKIDAELIKADVALLGIDMNQDGIPDQQEVADRQVNRENQLALTRLKAREQTHKEFVDESTIALKHAELAFKERDSKRNLRQVKISKS